MAPQPSDSTLIQSILATTRKLLEVPATTGFEKPLISYLCDLFAFPEYTIDTSHKGVVAITKPGNKYIVSAHIDRHGVIINEDEEYESAYSFFLRHNPFFMLPSQLLKRLHKHCDMQATNVGSAVFAYEPVSGKIQGKGTILDITLSETRKTIYKIVGLPPLPIHTPIAYYTPLSVNDDGFISAQIDNVISIAVAYELMKNGVNFDLLLTSEEELGNSWQYIIQYLAKQHFASKELIILDTSPYKDVRACSEGLVILRNKDEHGNFNSSLVTKLKQSCDEKHIKYELKDELIAQLNKALPDEQHYKRGNTELGRLVENTHGKVNGATVQLPTQHYHSTDETTHVRALSCFYRLLHHFFSAHA